MVRIQRISRRFPNSVISMLKSYEAIHKNGLEIKKWVNTSTEYGQSTRLREWFAKEIQMVPFYGEFSKEIADTQNCLLSWMISLEGILNAYCHCRKQHGMRFKHRENFSIGACRMQLDFAGLQRRAWRKWTGKLVACKSDEFSGKEVKKALIF